MNINNKKWPYQKRSTNSKNLQFCIDVLEAAENMSSELTTTFDIQSINDNEDLINGRLDPSRVEHVVNPMGLKSSTFRPPTQSYPLCRDKIDLLLGEEWKRKFDFSARLVNPETIRLKHEEKAQMVYDFLAQMITDPSKDEETNNKLLKRFAGSIKKWKDLREERANRILDMEYRNLDLKEKFNQGFKNLIVRKSELYAVDIVNGRTEVRIVDINNIKAVRLGKSKRLDDADIIIEETYESPGWIIDRYYNDLKESEIKKIDSGLNEEYSNEYGFAGAGDFINFSPIQTGMPNNELAPIVGRGNLNTPFSITRNPNADNTLINLDSIHNSSSSPIDEHGNIRVTRVVWRSLRKLGVKEWNNNGEVLEKIVDENYKPNTQLGEKIKWVWVSEYWRVVRIGNDIYPEYGHRPVQFRQFGDISSAGSGYIGDTIDICPVDLMKPFQILYDVIMEKTKHAFMTSRGKVAVLDLARKPSNWSVHKWYHYLDVMNAMVENSFSEGQVGVSKGKIAGNMNQSTRSIDLENGQYIQQHILMLNYIEQRIGDIAGIPKAREGQSSPTETATGIQNSVTQSYHITEPYFAMHDNIKRRVLQTVLESTKYCIRKNPKLYEYYLDEKDIIVGQLDVDEFTELSLGIDITSTGEDTTLINQYKQLAQTAIQNDKLKLSTLAYIYESKSMSDVRNRIEEAENSLIEQQSQAAESQNKILQSQIEREDTNKQLDRESEEKMNTEDNKTGIMKKLIDLDIAQLNNDNKSDEAYNKAIENYEKMLNDLSIKDKEFELKKQELALKDKEIGAKKIQENKAN